MSKIRFLEVLAILFSVSIGSFAAQHGAVDGQWRTYGGDSGATKYATLYQINKDNVGKVQILWHRPAVDPSLAAKDPAFRTPANFRVTPIMVNGVLYSPNGVGLVEAFDAASGKTIWLQEPFTPKDYPGDSTRGVAYWSGGGEERIIVQRGEYLYALAAKTGKIYDDF